MQKNRHIAALKQPLSPCKGDQKLQSNEPGWASSLTATCKGERSTQNSPLCHQPYSTGRETRSFPEAAADKVCSGRSREARCHCLEVRMISWWVSRTARWEKEHPTPGTGWEPDPHVRFPGLAISSREQFYLQRDLCSREIASPFLLQLGNAGANILLTFPRLPSQSGEEKPDLSWSVDQSLKNTKQSSLQLQGHKVCGLVFSQRA